jgi:tetratricopeptide (TPR) repeat protein
LQQSALRVPKFVDATCKSAWNTYSKQAFAATLRLCDDILEHEPRQPIALLIRALTLYELNRIDEALASVDAALEIRPDFGDAFTLRGKIFDHINKSGEAIEAYTQAIQFDAENKLKALENRAWLYIRQGNTEAAAQDIETAFQLADKSTSTGFLYCLKGFVYLDKGELDAALASCNVALTQEPAFRAAAYLLRARIHTAQKAYAEALCDAGEAIELTNDKDAKPFVERATIFDAMEDYAHAIEDYSRAIELLSSPDAYLFVDRAWSYQRANQLEAAIQDIDKAIQHSPNPEKTVRWLFTKSNWYASRRRYADAIAVLNHIVEEDPNSHEAYNDCAYFQIHIGELAQALSNIQKAIVLNSQTAAYYDTRAHVYFALAQYQDALHDFEQADKLTAQHAAYQTGIAVSHFKLGHIEKARTTWQKLIDLDPRYKGVETLIEDFHPAEPFVEAVKQMIVALEA